METEIFYHGSTVLFDRFDLSHALEGDGKMEYHLPKTPSASSTSSKGSDVSAEIG